MFDAKRGVRLLHGLHDEIVAREDVDLWYSDSFYDVVGCWAHAANQLLPIMDRDDVADLMAAVICTSAESVALDLFRDGFSYWLGIKLKQIHTDGE